MDSYVQLKEAYAASRQFSRAERQITPAAGWPYRDKTDCGEKEFDCRRGPIVDEFHRTATINTALSFSVGLQCLRTAQKSGETAGFRKIEVIRKSASSTTCNQHLMIP
ncbi:hypothetical protein AOLI_G00298420 [Acnodon oligacanthus]